MVELLVANEKAAGSNPVPRSNVLYLHYSITKNGKRRYYIGSTNNIKRRLKEHNKNQTSSLKNRGPFKLIYRETYLTRKEAAKREYKIKSYKGGMAFKKLISERKGKQHRSPELLLLNLNQENRYMFNLTIV